MSDNKRNGSFAGKGYYIALILCVAAIGITSYVYYRNAGKVQEVSLQETEPDVLVGTMGTEDVPVMATQPQTTATNPPRQESAPTTAPTEKPALKTASPVPGETIAAYSMEALSYNQTTRDWRVHNGVDIAAEVGTEICAAASGVVASVYEDDAMGYTVEIRHDGGYTTTYSSLAENVAVQAGDKVALGQTIGYAADTAIVETTLGSHIHFAVKLHDEPMDPAEFLALGQ